MKRERLGPYRVIGDLGQGGMGAVYLAEVDGPAPGLAIGTRVALKVIHPHLLETAGFFKRFLREADIGRAVAHTNVVRCFDCDAIRLEGDHHHYLVMEYVEGQTLRSLLDDLEVVPEELCRHVAREIAKGLTAIHAGGVVHRDLKPENVLITDEHVVKIMDLGVARLQDEALRLSQSGVFLGSLLYAAPEAFRGDGVVDARGDLYAVGVLLYELATGQHPYRHEDAKVVIRRALDGEVRRAGALNPQLSPYFEEVVHTLMAKEPDDRFASAALLLETLEQGEASSWWEERAQALRERTRRPLRRIRIPRETALYGRDAEMDRLRRAYFDAKEGRGRVILIEGEAGIGKTRLVDELVRALEGEGEEMNVLFGSYPPGGAATASGAFSTAYREHFGSGRLEESLLEYVQPTPVLVPAFAALLRGEPPPTGAEPLTKDSLQTVFVHTTRALADERPTVVLIDDLHFAPAEGRGLFASLALAVADHRVLLIGTMRRGVPQSWVSGVERLSHTERCELHRLGPKDLARLLEDALQSKLLAAELGHEIAVKSDGNPFFAFEIIRGLKEGNFITQTSAGSWVTTRVIRDIQVPSSVVDLVQARVSDLAEEERDLLDVAACYGYRFDPGVVAEASGRPLVPALKALGRIERTHHLVRTAGRYLVFDHHQVQESLYAALIPQLREAYHAAIAEVLARAVADAPGPEVEGRRQVLLVEHSLKGRQGAGALPHLDAALDHLEARWLNEPALDLLERAIAIPEFLVGERRITALLRKNGRLEILGRRDDQKVVIEEAAALVDDATPRALALEIEIARGNLRHVLGDAAAATDILKRCLADAKAAGERKATATALGQLGNAVYSLGRYEEAREYYEECLAIAREIEDPLLEGMARGSLGNVHGMLGDLTAARSSFEELVRLSRATGNRRTEGAGNGNLGVVYLLQGDYEEAIRYLELRLDVAREIGDRHGEAHAIGHIGNSLRAKLRYEEACEYGERYVAITEELGDRQAQAMSAGYLGDTYLALGRHEEAMALYERQWTLALEIESPAAEVRAAHSLAALHHRLGRLKESWEYHQRGREKAEASGDRFGEVYLIDDFVEVLSLLGEEDAARDLASRMRSIAHEMKDVCAQGSALHRAATVEEQSGHGEKAREFAAEALEIRRARNEPLEIAASLVLLARIEAAADRPEEAERALAEAIELIPPDDPDAQLTAELARLELGLPSSDVDRVRSLIDARQGLLDVSVRMSAHYALWRASGDARDLAEAKQLLDHLLVNAPEACRRAMREEIPLHGRILADAREQELDAQQF